MEISNSANDHLSDSEFQESFDEDRRHNTSINVPVMDNDFDSLDYSVNIPVAVPSPMLATVHLSRKRRRGMCLNVSDRSQDPNNTILSKLSLEHTPLSKSYLREQREMNLFQNYSPPLLHAILENITCISYTENSIIQRAHVHVDTILILLQGEVEVLVPNGTHQEFQDTPVTAGIDPLNPMLQKLEVLNNICFFHPSLSEKMYIARSNNVLFAQQSGSTYRYIVSHASRSVHRTMSITYNQQPWLRQLFQLPSKSNGIIRVIDNKSPLLQHNISNSSNNNSMNNTSLSTSTSSTNIRSYNHNTTHQPQLHTTTSHYNTNSNNSSTFNTNNNSPQLTKSSYTNTVPGITTFTILHKPMLQNNNNNNNNSSHTSHSMEQEEQSYTSTFFSGVDMEEPHLSSRKRKARRTQLDDEDDEEEAQTDFNNTYSDGEESDEDTHSQQRCSQIDDDMPRIFLPCAPSSTPLSGSTNQPYIVSFGNPRYTALALCVDKLTENSTMVYFTDKAYPHTCSKSVLSEFLTISMEDTCIEIPPSYYLHLTGSVCLENINTKEVMTVAPYTFLYLDVPFRLISTTPVFDTATQVCGYRNDDVHAIGCIQPPTTCSIISDNLHKLAETDNNTNASTNTSNNESMMNNDTNNSVNDQNMHNIRLHVTELQQEYIHHQ